MGNPGSYGLHCSQRNSKEAVIMKLKDLLWHLKGMHPDSEVYFEDHSTGKEVRYEFSDTMVDELGDICIHNYNDYNKVD